MIFASWNVNGLRSVLSKGFVEWACQLNPDIIALQEIKTDSENLNSHIAELKEHFDIHLHCAHKKGYSGTALLINKKSKHKPMAITTGIGEKKYDDEGRLIIAEYDTFFLLNGYFPNGQRDHSRVEFKLDFSRKVFDLAHQLEIKHKKNTIITGDLNTAHTEIDLSNPKSNSNTTGFLPEERQFIDEIIQNGYVDIFRHFYPEKKEQYTWWTYRSDCRERNIGWRLDYFFCNQALLKNCISIEHQTDVKGSDHCPVILKIKN